MFERFTIQICFGTNIYKKGKFLFNIIIKKFNLCTGDLLVTAFISSSGEVH